MRHFIGCKSGDLGTSAPEIARLMNHDIFKHHGLPDSIVSDRGPQFVSEFWKAYCARLGIKVKLSTAYHPQTDGQSENTNQWLEQYLRGVVNYHQDDWLEHLPMAQFALNNQDSATTGMSPFFLNYGYNPRMSFFPYAKEGPTTNAERIQRAQAKSIAEEMKDLLAIVRNNMEKAQEAMAKYANRKRSGEEFQVGDKVWLDARNLKRARPSHKLDHKREGPFDIVAKRGHSFELALPQHMSLLHPVFAPELLTKHPNNPMDGQALPEPGPIILEEEEQAPEWEVEEIVDARRRSRKLQYRAKWKGWDEDNNWYDASGFAASKELVKAFHEKYPLKPKPRNLRSLGTGDE